MHCGYPPPTAFERWVVEIGSFQRTAAGGYTRHDHTSSCPTTPNQIWANGWVLRFLFGGCRLGLLASAAKMRTFVSVGGHVRERPANEKSKQGRNCEVALTQLAARDDTKCWSLGLAAHGELEGVEATLMDTVAVLSPRSPPTLPPGQAANDPAWLSSQAW